ncbi:polysaccharide biosynthesis PFTS motif protein [Rhizobium sp. M1]|uniref:polysaccharide biosynthesis PFTS motif protein n=1 Tax=Rhizobium sp. M1 TaxID=2035453 RepID=UPI0015966BC8|nr:polysaccharide biosynthesis PFTS motif protein [Rhizobium sp. M1]
MRLPRVIKNVLVRHKHKAIRQYMRGYRQLRGTGDLARVEDIKDALAHTEICVAGKASVTFFGASLPFADKVIRQYLLITIAEKSLNRKLLAACAHARYSIVHPLPEVWRRTLAAHGFPVSNLRCQLLWMAFLVAMYCYGLVAISRTLMTALARRDEAPMGDSAYFAGISAGQLPRRQEPSWDVFSWYASWASRAPALQALTHSIGSPAQAQAGGLPLRFVRQPQPPPVGFYEWSRLAWRCCGLIYLATASALRGRWWHALLLREAVRAAEIQAVSPDRLPKDYLINNSGWLYRPIWTYFAEAAGSRVLFYFYSTNCEVFKKTHGYPRQSNHWELCSWSSYLVWDEYQKDFIRRLGLDGDIYIVGPIWFSDADARIPQLTGAKVAVFDVQPMRDSIYQSFALSMEYYTPDTAIRFAEDVVAAVQASRAHVLWKRKRNIGRNVHPLYVQVLNRLTNEDRIVSIEPSLAAQHVIAVSDCVVSMPFTSTAIVARTMNKPSCYYDPTGLVEANDRAAHGIEILKTAGELNAWIQKNAVVHASVDGSGQNE